MSRQSVRRVERVISLLEQRHAHLVEVLRGRPLSDEDHRLFKLSTPHVGIDEMNLRVAISDVSSALKEAGLLAKSSK